MSWLETLSSATAERQFVSADPLCLQLAPGERIAIVGSRDGGRWLVGYSIEKKTWGLFPSNCVLLDEENGVLDRGIARRELHEYYMRHHRDKIHKLDALLASAEGNFQAVFDSIERAFGHKLTDKLHPEECRLDSPRQVASNCTSVTLTWTTRELYECNFDEPRRGNRYLCLAVRCQDAMLCGDGAWTVTLPEGLLAAPASEKKNPAVLFHERQKSAGVTSATVDGLSPGATYRVRLSLWDVCKGIAVATSDSVSARTMSSGEMRRRASHRLEQSEIEQLHNLRERHYSSPPPLLRRHSMAVTVPSTPPRDLICKPSVASFSPTAPVVPPRSAEAKRNRLRSSKSTNAITPPLPRRRRASHQVNRTVKAPPPIRPRRLSSGVGGDAGGGGGAAADAGGGGGSGGGGGATAATAAVTAVPGAKYAKLLCLGFFEMLQTEDQYVKKMKCLVEMIQTFSAFDQDRDGNGGGSDNKGDDSGKQQNSSSNNSSSAPGANAMRKIFINLETLVGVNSVLLAGLHKLVPLRGFKYPITNETKASQSATFVEQCVLWTSISHLIIRTWPFFRCYKDYAVGHAARMGGVEAALKDQMELKEFLFERQHWNSSTLEAELIKPVQRILKYSLFLRDALRNVEKGADVQSAADQVQDPEASTAAAVATSSLEKALLVVNRVSAEVNEALSRNERSREILGLWARMGRRPENFLQPGRELLHVCVVECAPGMDTQRKGVAYGKRKEYLLAVLSDILIFARPNGKRYSVIDDDTREEDKDIWLPAPFDPEKGSSTHHPKHMTRIEHLDVSSSVYSSTQPRGKCGIDVCVLGKPDSTRGESPYRCFAIWCETSQARDTLRAKIEEALQAHLYAFFSRRKAPTAQGPTN